MPYRTDDLFTEPDNKNIKIWRYMDLNKFESILQNKSLWFARADQFDDKFEGSYPHLNYEEAQRNQEISDRHSKIWERADKDYVKNLPRYHAINCWHMNDVESAAMWKLYLNGGDGIAIQSTYCLLKDNIIDDVDVYLGIVNYINYKNEKLDASNYFNLYLNKRKSFVHEQELRGIIVKMPPPNKSSMKRDPDWTVDEINKGVPVKVCVENLIQNVFVAPTSSPAFLHEVNSLIKSYGFNFIAQNSEMNGIPLF